MRCRISILPALLAVFLTTGCQVKPTEVAAASGSGSLNIPVGPIPGPPLESRLPSNPFAQDRVALARGRQLFVHYNCSGCHGGHAGGGMGPSLRDLDWIYGGADAQVFNSIAEGRAHGMPAWGTKIPQDEIWRLTAYVKSLRTALEPEPPEQR